MKVSKEVIIELPKNTKYKLQQCQGILDFKRVMKTPAVHNYGLILDSEIQQDGDPADCFICTNQSLYPLVRISLEKLELVGIMVYYDNEERDDKYIFKLKDEKLENNNFLKEVYDWLHSYKNDTNYVEKIYTLESYKNSLCMNDFYKSQINYCKDLNILHSNYLLND